MTSAISQGPTASTRPATPIELAAQLDRLRVEAGGLIMVHASLRALGPLDGRAEGMIKALRRAVKPDGTLLMMVGADGREPFDRLRTPADPDNGVLAEVFRTYPGVEVNDHPACRFAAQGPLAAMLLEPQPLDDYFGPGSPLERFVEHGGKVLRLGADIDTITLTHYAENLAAVPDKRRVTCRYIRADTGELTIESLDDTEGIGVWARGDYFGQILIDYLAEGKAAVGQVGRCTAELLDGGEFVLFAVEWLERVFAVGADTPNS